MNYNTLFGCSGGSASNRSVVRDWQGQEMERGTEYFKSEDNGGLDQNVPLYAVNIWLEDTGFTSNILRFAQQFMADIESMGDLSELFDDVIGDDALTHREIAEAYLNYHMRIVGDEE